MRCTVTFSRRTVVAGLLCAPLSVNAAPLVDLEKGAGLFSDKVMLPVQTAGRSMTQLYSQQASIDPAEHKDPRPRRTTLHRSLPLAVAMQNANTGERLFLDLPASLELGWMQRRRLNHFMRDWREDKVKKIDPAIVQDLLEICGAFATPGTPTDVTINSGYRSQKTNEMLRQRSRQVARNSLHVEGKAIDFALPGVSQRQLSAVAHKVCHGGVGTYGTFVHIDSGSTRRWSA